MTSRTGSFIDSVSGWILLATAIASAMPSGGNRPNVWAAQSGLIFGVTAILLVAASLRGRHFPAGRQGIARLDLLPIGSVLGFWFAGLVVFQILPAFGALDQPWNVDPQNSLVGGCRLSSSNQSRSGSGSESESILRCSVEAEMQKCRFRPMRRSHQIRK